MRSLLLLVLVVALILPACATPAAPSNVQIPVAELNKVGELAQQGARFDTDGDGVLRGTEVTAYTTSLVFEILALWTAPPQPAAVAAPQVTPQT